MAHDAALSSIGAFIAARTPGPGACPIGLLARERLQRASALQGSVAIGIARVESMPGSGCAAIEGAAEEGEEALQVVDLVWVVRDRWRRCGRRGRPGHFRADCPIGNGQGVSRAFRSYGGCQGW